MRPLLRQSKLELHHFGQELGPESPLGGRIELPDYARVVWEIMDVNIHKGAETDSKAYSRKRPSH